MAEATTEPTGGSDPSWGDVLDDKQGWEDIEADFPGWEDVETVGQHAATHADLTVSELTEQYADARVTVGDLARASTDSTAKGGDE